MGRDDGRAIELNAVVVWLTDLGIIQQSLRDLEAMYRGWAEVEAFLWVAIDNYVVP